MCEVTSEEAKTRLNDLIEAALHGEKVIITLDNERKVQLAPIASPKRNRVAGLGKGTFAIREDFDEPLPEFEEYTE